MRDSFYKKNISLIAITFFCQLINLVRDILLARCFGASNYNDIYLVSQTVVSVIVSMINSPIATAYVPIATKYFVMSDHKSRDEFLGMIYGDVLLLAGLITFFEIVSAFFITGIIAPGFDKRSRMLVTEMLIIQSPITFINIIKGVNRGNFQILQRFKISEITFALPYVAACIYLLLPHEKNVLVLAAVLTVGTVLSIVPEIIILYKNGLIVRLRIHISNDIKVMIHLMSAAVITGSIREINILFDKAIGSVLPEGSITMLSYASRLSVVVVGIIGTSISLIGFASVAKFKSEGRTGEVLENVANSLGLVNFFIIPIAMYLSVFAEDIVTFLFGGGNFKIQSIKTTASLMRIYSIGLIGYGFQDVYTRTLHAYKVVKYTIKESAIIVITNIVFSLLLYRVMGAHGVALATSISILVAMPILRSDFRKVVGLYDSKAVRCEIAQFFMASLVTVGAAFGLKHIFKQYSVLLFVVESILCLIVYLLMCAFLKNRTFGNIMHSYFSTDSYKKI